MIYPMRDAQRAAIRRGLADGTLRVDLDTGVVSRIDDRCTEPTYRNTHSVDLDGYIQIPVRGAHGRNHTIRAHCIVYMAAHGEIPAGHVIEHRDGNHANNVPSNLVAIPVREAIAKSRRIVAQTLSLAPEVVLRAREMARTMSARAVARALHISTKAVMHALDARPHIAGAEQAVPLHERYQPPRRGTVPRATPQRMRQILDSREDAGLPTDDRLPAMIAMRNDGYTYAKIAASFGGITRERVRQLLNKAEKYIREADAA